MTQIQLQPSGTGKKSQGKTHLKIDMTPMVDLGFLLISFFIFTTSMSKPVVTKLYMPADGHGGTLLKDAALTVLLSGNDSIFYYHGKWEEAVRKNNLGVTNYEVRTGIGKIIREKQKHLGTKRGDLMLLIKPMETSSYNNLINMIDEVTINDIKKYAITDVTGYETDFIDRERINKMGK